MTTLQLTWRLSRYRPGLFALTCLAWASFHMIPLASGLILRWAFNALSNGSLLGSDIWTVVILIVGIALVRVSIMAGGVWGWSSVYFIYGSLLRNNLLDWLMRAPGIRRLAVSPGEAVSRFRDDVDEIIEQLENWTDAGGFITGAVIAIAVMASVDPVITAVALLPMLGMLLFGRRVGDVVRRYRRVNREATGRITSFIGETFGAVQAVKVAGAERHVLDHFHTLNETRRAAAVKDTLFNEMYRSVNTNMVNIGVGLVLLLGAGAMTRGTFTVGDFVLFVAYLQRLSWSMLFIGDLIAHYRRSGVSFDRMRSLLADAPDEALVRHTPMNVMSENGGDTVLAPVVRSSRDHLHTLEVRGFTARHPETGRGVEGIDLTVRRGEFVVVTGRIGCGKSTLLRALLGVIPHQAGMVWWNGEVVEDLSATMIPPRVAYTAQAPRLFSEALRDTILLGHTGPEHTLEDALALAELSTDIDALEAGLMTQVGPRGVKLSGGQVQRSAAARALVRTPELLVLDDLSSALDVETERRLWAGLFERREATCLVASHRRAALRRADRILVLEDGRAVDTGTLDELLPRCPELQRLWDGEAWEQTELDEVLG